MSINLNQVISKIDALSADTAGCAESYEESKAAAEALATLDWNNADDLAQFMSLAKKAVRYTNAKTISDMEATLTTDLMEGTHKYIVTDTDALISPAGFHPDDKVFVQTAIAIHTDSLDNLPYSNVALFAHTISTDDS